jgi:hypothetical protein
MPKILITLLALCLAAAPATRPVSITGGTLDGQTYTMTGYDAMLHAIMVNDIATAKALLEEGSFDQNRPMASEGAWTMLHLAAQKDRIEIARLMLEHGADPTVRNHGGLTPAEVAANNKHPELAALLAEYAAKPNASRAAGLVVHEWGTFTSLQDETGRTIGAINSDDEPLPNFVHDLMWNWSVLDATAQKSNKRSQGWPQAHPDVTMRLETPVLYVYPGPGLVGRKMSASVEFHGGWLTQFYPDAEAVKPPSFRAPVSPGTRGWLSWENVTVGGDASPPKTDAHVWVTPRKVKSAMLTSAKGASEKYLFYRGVGNVEAPLKVVQSDGGIEIETRLDPKMPVDKTPVDKPPTFSRLWFCTFSRDGKCAWRSIDAIDPSKGKVRSKSTFAESDFSTDNFASLRKDMHVALVTAGLFEDEAEAMLATWELSYFKSWGTRLFYIVPPAWTEHVLPLTVAPQPPELRRVMVGRIDLVTPEHRALLAKLASATDVKAQDAELWQTYDQLGRFRNALLLDEMKRHATKGLIEFVNAHALQGFAPG